METDRTDVIAVAPDRLWAVLADVGGYPSFWPWLRHFDGRDLRVGATWRGVIDTGTPLRLTVTLHLTEVVPERSVAARLGGDLSGSARVEVAPDGDGAALRLTATLAPERADLRILTRWARPLAQASHDRVITRALAQLTTHAS
ncbi:MAG TPA: SRPBCC family protein [Iamia sp.]|nr:SRPBCC family protein [Iamia sp.]